MLVFSIELEVAMYFLQNFMFHSTVLGFTYHYLEQKNNNREHHCNVLKALTNKINKKYIYKAKITLHAFS